VRILLSYENFEVFGGTETYIRTVALELLRLGHEPVIYAPNGGLVADLAREQGLSVLTRHELPDGSDAVLSHDAATAHELARRFPGAVRAFVAHSRDGTLQETPQLPEVCQAAVVLNDRVRRWVEARAAHPPLTRLRQPIALERYRHTRPPRREPRRVLVTSNYVEGLRGALIEQACLKAGLELDWIGATTRPSASPERALAAADIVIGLGRSVLEAMAAGRATYVYGAVGGDGWVTPDSYPALEADGFAGMVSGQPMTVSRLADELAEYRPDMGEANRDLATVHHSARTHTVELVSLIGELSASSEPALAGSWTNKHEASRSARTPSPLDEIARLLRLEWEMRTRAMRSAIEADDLRAERDRQRASAQDAIARLSVLDRELERARCRLADLEAHLHESRAVIAERDEQLRAVVKTRRYRLAESFAAPLELVRARLRRSERESSR
jgi:hypothetical protein